MTLMPLQRFLVVVLMIGAIDTEALAQEREQKVRNDRKTVEEEGYWIYNDLPKALDEAKKTGKPLLVTIRCIPCEACAKLDAQVVNRDPVVRKLLDDFVCVRIVQANGLDLSLFQYDYDQSFTAFFLNADKTIYGRYGTRSHETESERDVSVVGFGKALAGALELHKQYPAIKGALTAKRGAAAAIPVPEEFPSLKGRYGSQLDYQANIVRSCIHCHQVGEALRLVYHEKKEPIPERVLYPYPLPDVLGLTFDPKEKATVLRVAAGSTAERDGFRPGDEIATLGGQPLLSIADAQWVLHNAGDSGRFTSEVLRAGKELNMTLTLEPGWRQRGDISWRATSWDLRRMTTGGMRLDNLSAEEREKLGLAENVVALRARHVGEYGAHAAAKNAGFRKGDVLVEIDGKSDLLTESQLMARFANEKRPGDRVPVVVLREGKQLPLELPIQ
jgi:hypothetical protein